MKRRPPYDWQDDELSEILDAWGPEDVRRLLSRLRAFVRALTRAGLHVGIGNPASCVTCGVAWPCAHAPAPARGADMREEDWLAQVRDLALLRGWAPWHTRWSPGSDKGWPDLALARGPRLIVSELKTDKGKFSPEQVVAQEILLACRSVEYYAWRPADLEAVGHILR